MEAKLSAEELAGIAIAGLKQLKAETNNNGEIFAILQLINTLLVAEG